VVAALKLVSQHALAWLRFRIFCTHS
jgi:hypothetical protein